MQCKNGSCYLSLVKPTFGMDMSHLQLTVTTKWPSRCMIHSQLVLSQRGMLKEQPFMHMLVEIWPTGEISCNTLTLEKDLRASNRPWEWKKKNCILHKQHLLLHPEMNPLFWAVRLTMHPVLIICFMCDLLIPEVCLSLFRLLDISFYFDWMFRKLVWMVTVL